MNKKYISLIISFIAIFFLSQIFIKSEELLDTFFSTINLWFKNLFPSIFIFFIITDILNNYQFPYYLSNLLGNIFNKIFHLPKVASYIVFMSMTSGFPGNSKLILEALENKEIDDFDATRLLTMTHFSNPLFIIYSVGINFYHDKTLGIIILISHFITNFIVGFCFRNIYKNKNNYPKLKLKEPKPFMEVLKTSIANTFVILTNVLGIIIFFSLITKTINLYLNLNTFSNILINGLLEITNGLSILGNTNMPIIPSATLATFFISFGGFSIHMQIMSILNKYSVNYYIYLISRLMHAAISSIITFLILINIY